MLILFRLTSRCLAALPLGAALAIGRGFGWFLAHVVRHRRKETVTRIHTCLPDKDMAVCRSIYCDMFANLGMNIVEMLRVSHRGLADMEGRVTIHGRDNLETLQGGGLVLMAHIGNWENCGYVTNLLDSTCTVVVKPIKNAGIQGHVEATRKNMNLEMLPHTGSYRECLRRLQQGHSVAIILDQNRTRAQGVFVDYFGQPACTSPGLALMSAQMKIPVVPLFDVRRGNRDHDLHVLPPIPPPESRKIDALTEATQHYTKVIEDMVRRHPEQWTWLHRRWRTKPDEKETAELESPSPQPSPEGEGNNQS